MSRRSISLDNINKREKEEEKYIVFEYKRAKSIPDINLQNIVFKKAITMTVIDDARKGLNCTDGTKDIQKFIYLADKYHAKVRNQALRENFNLVLLSKLEGKAYEVAKNLGDFDWESLKEALEAAFIEKRTITSWHTQLANCIQKNDETVFSFSLRLKELLLNISKAYKEQDENINFYDTNAPALSAFEEGLLDPSIRVLIKAKAETFEEAIELAMLEERRKINLISKQQPQSKYCTHCEKNNHTLSECVKFKEKNNVCMLCKSVGHFPSDCPNKSQKPKWGNKAFNAPQETQIYNNRPQEPRFYNNNRDNRNNYSNPRNNNYNNQNQYNANNYNSSRNPNNTQNGRPPNQNYTNINNQRQNRTYQNEQRNGFENDRNYFQSNRVNFTPQRRNERNQGNDRHLTMPAIARTETLN
jgi:hypothetical protein